MNVPLCTKLDISVREEIRAQVRQQCHPLRIAAVIACTEAVPARTTVMLPPELTGGQLHYVVRRHLSIHEAHALFLLCGRYLVPPAMTVRELHLRYADPHDGYLYISCMTENAFG